MNIHDLQLHFSIRKLSVGVVSCLIGICFISSNQTVQADSMPIASNNKSVIISNSSSNSNPTETKSSNKQDIVDSNNTSPAQIDSHSNQNSRSNSNPTETIASKSNNKQNIVDSNNTSPTQINSHSNQNSTKMVLVNSKLNISSQQPATTDSASQQSAADSAKNKLKMATLKTTTDEKLNTKMLAESKATTMQATDTNGGFDSSWGKLDVNDWKGSVKDNYYQLTDYTGDANHVIVPNEADFAKAGISTSGKQVGVTSTLMRTIFKDKKATANDATVAFSKTDNKMVKAIDSDWSDTWGHSQPGDSEAKLSKFDGTNLDVSNVTNMSYMFDSNNISDLSPLANWNVGNVTDMSYMFESNQISDLSPLSNWEVGYVTNMRFMFYNNHISDLSPLANWNVGNVTDMSSMFYSNHISDLSPLANWSWNVGNVTAMSYMFYSNHISDLSPLANWNVGNVTDMRSMFESNQISDLSPLSNWEVGYVTNMRFMFYNNHISDLSPLANWNVGNVTDMSSMFYSNQISDLSPLANWSWNVGNVTDMSYMFYSNHISDLSPLANWNVGNVTDMSSMFASNHISDLSPLSNWEVGYVTNMRFMFYNNHISDLSPLANWNVGNVTDMSYMFYSNHISDIKPSYLTNIGNLSKWDTSKVTNMSYMFASNHISDLSPLANWNVGNVTDMRYMFYSNQISDLSPLANWNVGNVTDMRSMFASNQISDLSPLANWNVGNVTDMSYMFYSNHISDIKPSYLTNIGDLSKWNTSKVTNMSYMFASARALRHLNISNWNLTKLANKDAMICIFTNDTDLTVIANDLKLPDWYQKEINDAHYFWNDHMAVITNVSELIKSTGDVNDLKIDDQKASRSIFYDSKGSSDAIQVLKDANQAYINKYEQDHPKYLLALDTSVDQTDPIALANAEFKTSHKLIDVDQTDHATRTIIVHLPNGTMQTIVQTIGLKRNAQEDLVTEIISSTAPWGLDEANSSYTINGVKQAQTAYKQNSNIITFSSIKLPKVPGYKAKVTRNNGLLMVNYLVFAPEKLEANNNLSELQFSNKLATNSAVQFNSTVKSNIVVKSDMYQVVNDDHNWQLPVIKSYNLKFATNKNQIIFAYTKDKQYNYRFVLTFKDGQYRLTTFDKQGKLLKTYSIKSYKKLAKIIHSLVSMNIA